jgi:hypothetical protein
MIDTTIFHIYEKATDKPVKVCLTVDELEQMIAKHEVDFVHWEVQPCYTEYSVEDASF